MAITYEFARPAIAVDCVVFGLIGTVLKVLCIERALEPFRGRWALPGGFVRIDETLDAAARRELQEEAGVTISYLEQFRAFGALDRDPRERVVSVAYFALVNPAGYALRAATDAVRADWFAADALPDLAFDHNVIVRQASAQLRTKVRRHPVGFDLLPAAFSLTQLQRMYEAILGRQLDKRNFRKRIAGTGLLLPTDEHEQNVGRRPAQLFRFDRAAYASLSERGFDLEFV